MLNTGEPPKSKVLDQGPARVSYVYPKAPTSAQQSYISAYLEDFQNALWSESFADPRTGYAKYIDVDSWYGKRTYFSHAASSENAWLTLSLLLQFNQHRVDYWLHSEVNKNLDGYISSVYLHKDKGGKLVAGALVSAASATTKTC